MHSLRQKKKKIHLTVLVHTYTLVHQINSKLNSQNLPIEEQIYLPQQDIFPVYPK